jgi:hypothetical protein
MAWGIKPTLRRNGQMMRALTVKFSIGREQAAIAIAHKAETYGDTPATRRQAFDIIECYCYEYGQPTMEDVEEVDESVMARAYAITDKLFPELKGQTCRPNESPGNATAP